MLKYTNIQMKQVSLLAFGLSLGIFNSSPLKAVLGDKENPFPPPGAPALKRPAQENRLSSLPPAPKKSKTQEDAQKADELNEKKYQELKQNPKKFTERDFLNYAALYIFQVSKEVNVQDFRAVAFAKYFKGYDSVIEVTHRQTKEKKVFNFQRLFNQQLSSLQGLFCEIIEAWKVAHQNSHKTYIEEVLQGNPGSPLNLYHLLGFKRYGLQDIDGLKQILQDYCQKVRDAKSLEKGSRNERTQKLHALASEGHQVLLSALSRLGVFDFHLFESFFQNIPTMKDVHSNIEKSKTYVSEVSAQVVAAQPIPHPAWGVAKNQVPLIKAQVHISAPKETHQQDPMVALQRTLGPLFQPPPDPNERALYMSGLGKALSQTTKEFNANFEGLKQCLGNNVQEDWPIDPDQLRDATPQELKLYETITENIGSTPGLTDEEKAKATRVLLLFQVLHSNNETVCNELLLANPPRSFSKQIFASNPGDIVIDPDRKGPSLEKRAPIIYETLDMAWRTIKDKPELALQFYREAFKDTHLTLDQKAHKLKEWIEAHDSKFFVPLALERIPSLSIADTIESFARNLFESFEKTHETYRELLETRKRIQDRQKELENIRHGAIHFHSNEDRTRFVILLEDMIADHESRIQALTKRHKNWIERKKVHEKVRQDLFAILVGKKGKDGLIHEKIIDDVLINQMAWPLKRKM